MRLLYKEPFSKNDLDAFTQIVHKNMITDMLALVKACVSLKIKVKDVKPATEFLKTIRADTKMDSRIADLITVLWRDKGIKKAYKRRAEFQLNDSAGYFLKNIERILDKDYIATEQDALHSRVQTVGE